MFSSSADLASVDNNAATAWDYARGRQLHYCMLIIASYIRQRAQEEGRDPAQMMPMNGDTFPPGLGITMGTTLNGTFPSEMGETADEEHLGFRQLQVRDRGLIRHMRVPFWPINIAGSWGYLAGSCTEAHLIYWYFVKYQRK